MASTIKIKNSSTAGAVPTSSDLVQGELAINVTDRRIFTENASGTVVELGTPSIDDNGNATAITIDSSENVGIGTSSPVGPLDVVANSGAVAAVLRGRASDSVSAQRFVNNAGTTEYARFQVDSSSNLLFCTGSSSTERARIDSSGNLLVGTTTDVLATARATFKASSGAGVVSAVNSNTNLFCINTNNTSWDAVSFRYNTSTEVGRIACTSTATAYNTSSDYRLKENVQPMTGALVKVAALKPVTYTWKVDGSEGEGFIAHELAEVCPDAVTGEKDAIDADGNPVYQGIDVSFLVGTLTAAVQEQQALITTLTERITALEQA